MLYQLSYLSASAKNRVLGERRISFSHTAFKDTGIICEVRLGSVCYVGLCPG